MATSFDADQPESNQKPFKLGVGIPSALRTAGTVILIVSNARNCEYLVIGTSGFQLRIFMAEDV